MTTIPLPQFTIGQRVTLLRDVLVCGPTAIDSAYLAQGSIVEIQCVMLMAIPRLSPRYRVDFCGMQAWVFGDVIQAAEAQAA